MPRALSATVGHVGRGTRALSATGRLLSADSHRQETLAVSEGILLFSECCLYVGRDQERGGKEPEYQRATDSTDIPTAGSESAQGDSLSSERGHSVHLRFGFEVDVEVLRLALRLEAAGTPLMLDIEGQLQPLRPADIPHRDRRLVATHWRELVDLVRYVAALDGCDGQAPFDRWRSGAEDRAGPSLARGQIQNIRSPSGTDTYGRFKTSSHSRSHDDGRTG